MSVVMFIWTLLLWIPSGPTGEPSAAVSHEGSDEFKGALIHRTLGGP